MPQPHSTCSMPARLYRTVSWSGITSSPWRQQSSPVLTTTLSSSPMCAGRPSASFAPPTPPASATTRRHASRRCSSTSPIRSIVSASYGAGMSTRMCRNPRSRIGRRLSAIAAGSPTWVAYASSSSWPVERHDLPVRVERRLAGVADDQVDGDGLLDRRRVAADLRAPLAQPSSLPSELSIDPAECSTGRRSGRASGASSSGPDPPIMIGRRRWTGRGATSASCIGYAAPSWSRRARRRAAAGAARTDSSSRSSRSPKPLPKSIP